MPHIELTEYEPQPGAEWTPTTWPGEGAFLSKTGIFFVFGGTVYAINYGAWQRLVNSGAPKLRQGEAPAVDIHRLMDQLATVMHGREGASV